jgi:hypothetical protein
VELLSCFQSKVSRAGLAGARRQSPRGTRVRPSPRPALEQQAKFRERSSMQLVFAQIAPGDVLQRILTLNLFHLLQDWGSGVASTLQTISQLVNVCTCVCRGKQILSFSRRSVQRGHAKRGARAGLRGRT